MEDELYLIARVASQWLALPAVSVEAVVAVRDVVPAPLAPPSVRGLVAIRSRLLTLIDTALVAGEQTFGDAAPLMAIVAIDGHGYGLALDEVEDVVALFMAEVPARLGSGWQALVSGVADHQDGRALLRLDPTDVIAVLNSRAVDAAA